MNNKGFVFAETLVSTLIIMILLISFYVFSSNFIDNQSQNKSYDNIEEIYKLANIRLFLYRNVKFNTIIEEVDSSDGCVSLNNINVEDSPEYTTQYSDMMNEFKIKQMYICDFNRTNTFTDSFKDFFKYTQETYNDYYRIIAYFENKKFASIKAWRVGNE